MFELESLKELGLQGWPMAAAVTAVVVSVVSLFQGWPSFITINNHHKDCDCQVEDDE